MPASFLKLLCLPGDFLTTVDGLLMYKYASSMNIKLMHYITIT